MSNEELKIIADTMEDKMKRYPEKIWDYDRVIPFVKYKVDKARNQADRKEREGRDVSGVRI